MFMKNLNLLNPRGLAFALDGFKKIGGLNEEIYLSFKEKIENQLKNFDTHYINKIIKTIAPID